MKIVCQSCGKKYDTAKDELCPRCGSYNPFEKAFSRKPLPSDMSASRRNRKNRGWKSGTSRQMSLRSI